MTITLLTRIDVFLTLAIYDALRAVSRVTRRQADRINRLVDVDTLRGYHGFPGETVNLAPQDMPRAWDVRKQEWV